MCRLYRGYPENTGCCYPEKGEKLAFLCSKDNVVSKPVELVPFNTIHWSRYAVYFRHYDKKENYLAELKKSEQFKQEEDNLNKRTVDRVIIADAESEKMHKMEAVNSTAGENWRDASKGGYFMYEMKVRKEIEQSVCLQLLGSDSGNRIFDVLIDGKWIDTIDLSKPCKEGKGLYRCYIHIPAEYIKARKM